MEIKTKLEFGQKVLTLIDGKLISMTVDEIKVDIAKCNVATGGAISYEARRDDIPITADDPYEKGNVKFTEEEVGKTVFCSKEEMIEYISGLEVYSRYKR